MNFDTALFFDAIFSREYLAGAGLALAVAILAQAACMVLGFIMALCRISPVRTLRGLGTLYVWFFRAVPTLLILLVVWNVLPQLFEVFRGDWYTPFIAAFIGLTLVEGAFMTEVYRGALIGIDPGQRQAARALGLKPLQALFLVLVPQMVKSSIPSTGSRLIETLKLTSLGSVISLQELLAVASRNVSQTFSYLEYYGAAMIYYLVIVSAFMLIQQHIEDRYSWKTKKKHVRTMDHVQTVDVEARV